MKRFAAKAPKTDGHGATHRRRGVEGGADGDVKGGPSIEREMYRLQAQAGNAAVSMSMGEVAVQRHDAAQGATGAEGGSLPAPNPVVAALWKSSVQEPLRTAANAMVEEKPDYSTAFENTLSAAKALSTVRDALPLADPRRVKANYLHDDLVLTETILAPRANVTISTTDDEIAAKLGGFEYDAQVVGESLGGDPAPKQTVVPELGE